jgi:hypothetical protein
MTEREHLYSALRDRKLTLVDLKPKRGEIKSAANAENSFDAELCVKF